MMWHCLASLRQRIELSREFCGTMSIQKLRSSKLWTQCAHRVVIEFCAPLLRKKTKSIEIPSKGLRGWVVRRTSSSKTCSLEDVLIPQITCCLAWVSSRGQMGNRPQTNYSTASKTLPSSKKRTLRSLKTTPSSPSVALPLQISITPKRSVIRGKELMVR